jgi:hypothetical protein
MADREQIHKQRQVFSEVGLVALVLWLDFELLSIFVFLWYIYNVHMQVTLEQLCKKVKKGN